MKECGKKKSGQEHGFRRVVGGMGDDECAMVFYTGRWRLKRRAGINGASPSRAGMLMANPPCVRADGPWAANPGPLEPSRIDSHQFVMAYAK